jgi:glycosyltransferase involved in cell wall biosynthesis
MKVVFANKYWYLKRGAERYLFELKALLERHHHTVIPFAMRGEKDEPTEWRKYFVSPVVTDRVRFDWQGLRTAGRTLYSFEARYKFARLLDAAKPDLVHVHNIYHQISPSILPAAKRRGLPVVLTAHDYNLIAPNYALYHDGSICERTKPAKYWEAVRHRCVSGSVAASALAATEKYLQKWLGLYGKTLDRVIAPSKFVRSTLIAYGIDQAKVVHIPHFIDASTTSPLYGGDYALFVGSASEEKGIDVAIEAAILADVPLRIVGGGPLLPALKDLAEKKGGSNVIFTGPKYGDDLLREYAGARFIVIPSLSYETFGLTALEAYALGKPIIASRIGGLPEVVREGETGMLAPAGDIPLWTIAMTAMWQDPAACERMGREGRRWVETDFAPEQHYSRITAVYDEAMRR